MSDLKSDHEVYLDYVAERDAACRELARDINDWRSANPGDPRVAADLATRAEGLLRRQGNQVEAAVDIVASRLIQRPAGGARERAEYVVEALAASGLLSDVPGRSEAELGLLRALRRGGFISREAV